jgi:hypothetical protein
MDLGRYFELLDVALGLRAESGSPTPIAFIGFPPGYQSLAHPAQYDAATADDVGPLFNSLEAGRLAPVHGGIAMGMTMDPDHVVNSRSSRGGGPPENMTSSIGRCRPSLCRCKRALCDLDPRLGWQWANGARARR